MSDASTTASRRPKPIAAAALAGVLAIGGASWFAWRGDAAPNPVTVAPQTAPDRVAQTDRVEISSTRQGDTVRGALIIPNISNRQLTSGDLDGLSKAQLDAARAQIADGSLTEIEAANLRLIEQVAATR